MASRLLVLDKLPGIHQLCCSKKCRQLLANFLLTVTKIGEELECGIDQLRCGLHVGTEGGVHTMGTILESLKVEEESMK